MNMRLIGASSIADLNPTFVDARGLIGHGHVQTAPRDVMGQKVYDSLSGPQEKTIPRTKAKL